MITRAESQLTARDLRVFDLTGQVVPGELVDAVKLRITIRPPSGAVLVYNRASPVPVRFAGPISDAWVDLGGHLGLSAQLVEGALDLAVEVQDQRCNNPASAVCGPLPQRD
jgi:hypothetical protein